MDMKKLICLMLVLLTALAGLSSCGKKENPEKNESTEPGSTESTGSNSAADLPQLDLGGEFRILNNESNYAYTFMDAEETASNKVEYAVYQRNRAVEDKLNITISETRETYDVARDTFNRLINTGSQDFAIYFNEAWIVSQQALSGFLYDIYSVSTLSMSNPWWDANATQDLGVGEKLFGLVGDIHLMANESTWIVAYNQRIATNLGLGSYYDMVWNEEWTFDAFFTDIAVGAQDLDGVPGLSIKSEDIFGFCGYHGAVIPLLTAAGQELLSRDEDNMFVYNGIPETIQNVYEKIVDGIFDNAQNRSALQWNTPGLEDDMVYSFHDVFYSGNALFYIDCVGSLKKFSDMTDNYGILPIPKYSTDQQGYISSIARYCSMGGIPISLNDPEPVGTVLEYMGAYSSELVIPEYEQTLLENRYIRDPESQEIMRLIFSNRHFDIAGIYAVGASGIEVADGLAERVCAAASYVQPSLANYVNEINGKIESDLENIRLFYEALADR